MFCSFFPRFDPSAFLGLTSFPVSPKCGVPLICSSAYSLVLARQLYFMGRVSIPFYLCGSILLLLHSSHLIAAFILIKQNNSLVHTVITSSVPDQRP